MLVASRANVTRWLDGRYTLTVPMDAASSADDPLGLRVFTLHDGKHVVTEVSQGSVAWNVSHFVGYGGAPEGLEVGTIAVGDEVVAVNGASLRNVPHADVVTTLRELTSARASFTITFSKKGNNFGLAGWLNTAGVPAAAGAAGAGAGAAAAAAGGAGRGAEGISPASRSENPSAPGSGSSVVGGGGGERYSATLTHTNIGLGIRVHTSDRGMHIVSEVAAGGAAAAAACCRQDAGSAAAIPCITTGDILCQVDGRTVEGMDHDAVCTAVADAAAASASVSMLFQQGPNYHVAIPGEASGALGFRLYTLPNADGRHIVTEVAAAGLAAAHVSVGDYLVEVQGRDANGMLHDQITAACQSARAAAQPLSMVFARGTGTTVFSRGASASDAASAAALEPLAGGPGAAGRTVTVTLTKQSDNVPLGLRLRMLPRKAGGAVQIVGIAPDTLAAEEPALSVGQTIVSVNGADPASMLYMELLNLLSESYTIKLEVSDGAGAAIMPAGAGAITENVVAIQRGPRGTGLEIAVIGSGAGSGLCQVTHVPPEVLASASGEIHVGDIVVDVNGQCILGMAYSEVIGHMTAYKRMVLTVHREVDEFEETTTVPFGAGSQQASLAAGAFSAGLLADGGDPLWRPVALRRNTKGSFGFGLESDESTIGTRVINVNPELRGVMNEGDVIVGLNGQPVINMRHEVLVTEIMQYDDLELDVATAAVFDAMFRKVLIEHTDTNGLGIDLDTEEDEVYGTMVFLSTVDREGAAAAAGAEAGDQIISCNGVLLADCDHNQIVNMFERLPQLSLVLRAPQAIVTGAGAYAAAAVGASSQREVMLDKSAGGLGFSLTPWEENEAEAYGAFVSEIVPGGTVDRTKAVFLDDRLVEINGINVVAAPYDNIIGMLSAEGNPTIVVEGAVVSGSTGYTSTASIQQQQQQQQPAVAAAALHSNATQVTIFRQGDRRSAGGLKGFGIVCIVAGTETHVCQSKIDSVRAGSRVVAVNGEAYGNNPQGMLAAIADAGDSVNLSLVPPAVDTPTTVVSTVKIQTINNKCGLVADTEIYSYDNGEDYWEHKVQKVTNPAVVLVGSLNPGDLILKVNGQLCSELSHEDFCTHCTTDRVSIAPNGERELELQIATRQFLGSDRLGVRGDSNV